MALARGRTLLQENVFVGNVLVKPLTHGSHSRFLPRKNHTLLSNHLPIQQLGMGRALSTFCNKSLVTKASLGQSASTSTFLFNNSNEVSFNSIQQERSFASSPNNDVYLPNEVELSKVSFGAPRKNQKGGMFVPITYGSAGRTLRIQTPVTRIPFGLTSFDNQPGYVLQISFDDMDKDSQMKKFYEFIRKFDENVLTFAKAHHKEWFPGKNFIPQVIEANFKRNIREHKEAKYNPLMKFKIPVYKDSAEIEVYTNTSNDNNSNSESEPTTIEALTSNSMIVSVIEPRSVWFVSGNFGVTWTVRQAKIIEQSNMIPESGKLSSYSFRDNDIIYNPNLRTKSSNKDMMPESPNPTPPINLEDVLDEAFEEQAAEEEEEEVTPPPPPVKAKSTKSPTSSSPPSSSKGTTSSISSTVSSPKQILKSPTSKSDSKPVKAETTTKPPSKVVSSSTTSSKVVAKTPSSVSPIKSSAGPAKKSGK